MSLYKRTIFVKISMVKMLTIKGALFVENEQNNNP